jgi:hypothetical protein
MNAKCWLIGLILGVAVAASPARAQGVLDRKVGSGFGKPLVLTQMDRESIARLARAADVPMGVQAMPSEPQSLSVAATGRPLREVLDAIVAADPRYEWREDDGVIVILPVITWNDPLSPLFGTIGRLELKDVTATEAITVMMKMVGANRRPDSGMNDSRRFSVSLSDDATFLTAMNGIVRAHGSLTWGLDRIAAAGSQEAISLSNGVTSVGWGIPNGSRLAAPGMVGASIALESAVAPAGVGLNTRVGFDKSGRPFGVFFTSWWDAMKLAGLTGVPMIFESLPDSAPRMDRSEHEVLLTGLTLREALNRFVSVDRRYSWRAVDGVVVIRPQTSWAGGDSPLNRPVAGASLDETTLDGVVVLLVDPPADDPGIPWVGDTQRFSVSIPGGSLFDALVAVTKAHGHVFWAWQELPLEDRDPDTHYRLYVGVVGAGMTHGLPIP